MGCWCELSDIIVKNKRMGVGGVGREKEGRKKRRERVGQEKWTEGKGVKVWWARTRNGLDWWRGYNVKA